jgi:ubiquinone/menaquinone biosynthesis C-methylase UbiE
MKNLSQPYNKIAKEYCKIYSRPSKHLIDFLKLLPKNGNILDVGCGAGVDSNFIKSIKFTVVGIDNSKEMLKIARKNYPEIKFLLKDMRKIKFNDKKFDGIIFSYSLIHIPKNQMPKTLKRFSKIIKSNGYIYISLQLGHSKEAYINDPFGKNEKLFLNIMSLIEVKVLLKNAGFKIIFETKMKPKKNQLNFTKLFIFAQKY